MFQQMVVGKLIALALLIGVLSLLGGLLWGGSCLQKKWLASFASCVLIVFTLRAWIAIKEYEEQVQRYSGEIQRLRTLYPVESLELLLPPPPAFTRGGANLCQAARNNLSEIESSIQVTKGGEREELLLKLHEGSVDEFVRREGFGVMRMLSSYSTSVLADWKIMRLELLGLLLAEEPRVYVTEELPRMEKIRAAPTRALDGFEAVGLAKLQAGEELFIREAPPGIRMLGAVRSVKQCIQCHGGERGDLLGAFSYFLEKLP